MRSDTPNLSLSKKTCVWVSDRKEMFTGSERQFSGTK